MDRESAKFIKDLHTRDKNKDERLTGLETSEYTKIRMFTNPPAIVSTGNIAVSGTFLSADQRTLTSPSARGIFGVIYNFGQPAYNLDVYIGSSDQTPDSGYQTYRYRDTGGVITGNILMSQFAMIPLGADGKFKIVNGATSGGVAALELVYIGWWE